MLRTLVRVAVAGAALLIAVMVLEGALHVLRPAVAYQYAPQHMVVNHFTDSDDLPFELKRNFQGRFRMLEFDTSVSTNSLGLRDREIDFGKPRVLCVGDSFTFGFGVEYEESFCARLEAAFGGRYDFVSAGFADGTSPDTYALWLSRSLSRLQPRLIVCSLFQNDVTEVNGHTWEPDGESIPRRIREPGMLVTRDGTLARDNFVSRLPPALRTTIKQSYLIALLRDRLLRDADQAGIVQAQAPAQPLAATNAAPGDDRYTRALRFLRDAVGSTPMVIHLIPLEAQTGDSQMDRVVKQFAATAGWPVVQDYGAFTPADYFAQDGHWLPSGHAKAARYLHAALATLGL